MFALSDLFMTLFIKWWSVFNHPTASISIDFFTFAVWGRELSDLRLLGLLTRCSCECAGGPRPPVNTLELSIGAVESHPTPHNTEGRRPSSHITDGWAWYWSLMHDTLYCCLKKGNLGVILACVFLWRVLALPSSPCMRSFGLNCSWSASCEEVICEVYQQSPVFREDAPLTPISTALVWPLGAGTRLLDCWALLVSAVFVPVLWKKW